MKKAEAALGRWTGARWLVVLSPTRSGAEPLQGLVAVAFRRIWVEPVLVGQPRTHMVDERRVEAARRLRELADVLARFQDQLVVRDDDVEEEQEEEEHPPRRQGKRTRQPAPEQQVLRGGSSSNNTTSLSDPRRAGQLRETLNRLRQDRQKPVHYSTNPQDDDDVPAANKKRSTASSLRASRGSALTSTTSHDAHKSFARRRHRRSSDPTAATYASLKKRVSPQELILRARSRAITPAHEQIYPLPSVAVAARLGVC
jgi:hypothetical protein